MKFGSEGGQGQGVARHLGSGQGVGAGDRILPRPNCCQTIEGLARPGDDLRLADEAFHVFARNGRGSAPGGGWRDRHDVDEFTLRGAESEPAPNTPME